MTAARRKTITGAGWVITGFIGFMMTYGAIMKLRNPPEVTEHMEGQFGYSRDAVVALGIVEICCVIPYLIPRTAVLGAVLLTGYLGGGIATHVRIHDNFADAAIYGVLVWLGIYLRDSRV